MADYHNNEYTVKEDEAFATIGEAYYRGFGIKRDFNRAFLFYQKAANLGNIPALRRLGACYELGHGTKRDIEAALTCYETASEKGDAFATLKLGDFYRDGLKTYITCDRLKATNYYLAALQQAKQNYDVWNAPDIYLRVGDALRTGVGVERDVEAAYEFYVAAVNLYMERIDSGDSDCEPLLEQAEEGASICGEELGIDDEISPEGFEA